MSIENIFAQDTSFAYFLARQSKPVEISAATDMRKRIHTASMTGEQGFNLVAGRVTELGLLIKQYHPPEGGTDAIIEIRNPSTGEVSANFVAIQVKTRTKRKFTNENEVGFKYTVNEKDFDYYQNGNTPFVIFLVRLSDKKIYWKIIPKSNNGAEASRVLIFNKELDDFSSKGAERLITIFEENPLVENHSPSPYESKRAQIDNCKVLLINNNFSDLCTELSIYARSWIDSSLEVAAYAQNLLSDISAKITHWKGDRPPEFHEIQLWCEYLSSLRVLFSNPLHPNHPESAQPFSIQKIELARGTDLWEVFIAERMEYLSSMQKTESALAVANVLEYTLAGYPRNSLLEQKKPSTHIEHLGANKRYSIGTAYFLLSKFLRSGGLLRQALTYMELSKIYYCEGIPSHDNEIEHCQYALAVSHALLGQNEKLLEKVLQPSKGTPFVDALNKIAYSYYFWAQSKIDDAQKYAKLAGKEFSKLGLEPFKKKCTQLTISLELWTHLHNNNPISKFSAHSKYKTALSYIDKKGKKDFIGLSKWVKEQNPLALLGVFQYIESFFEDAYRREIELVLPKILTYEEGMRELQFQEFPATRSIEEAHGALKRILQISPGTPSPLFF